MPLTNGFTVYWRVGSVPKNISRKEKEKKWVRVCCKHISAQEKKKKKEKSSKRLQCSFLGCQIQCYAKVEKHFYLFRICAFVPKLQLYTWNYLLGFDVTALSLDPSLIWWFQEDNHIFVDNFFFSSNGQSRCGASRESTLFVFWKCGPVVVKKKFNIEREFACFIRTPPTPRVFFRGVKSFFFCWSVRLPSLLAWISSH